MSTARGPSGLSTRGALALLAIFAALAVIVLSLQSAQNGTSTRQARAGDSASAGANDGATGTRTGTSTRAGTSTRSGSSGPASDSLQDKARYVLAVVDQSGSAPSGYVGGRQFMNDGRGGTALLPRTDSNGRKLTYREYDVNPRRQGVNRGPQRLVVGSDGSAWMTADHYESWERLR